MATSNFCAVNTSRIFAFGSNKYITQEDIDANDWPQEWLGDFNEEQTRWDYEWTIDDVTEDLQRQGWQKCDKGDSMAYTTDSMIYGGVEIELTLYAQVNGGYYEGACFDLDGYLKVYDLSHGRGLLVDKYDMFGDYVPDRDTVINDDWTGYAGLNHLQADNIIKHLQAKIDDMCREAEMAFSRNCEHELYTAWHASNGETGYGEMSKRMCEDVA